MLNPVRLTFLVTSPGGICRANMAATRENEMSTEPEENSQNKVKIERVPEPMFGGTRERLEVVDDEEVSEDTDDKRGNQNRNR